MKKSKVMSRGLQEYIIRKLLAKKGFNPELIDIESELDSKLTLEENIEQLEHLYGSLTKEHQEREIEKAGEECKKYNKIVEIAEQAEKEIKIFEEARVYGVEINKKLHSVEIYYNSDNGMFEWETFDENSRKIKDGGLAQKLKNAVVEYINELGTGKEILEGSFKIWR